MGGVTVRGEEEVWRGDVAAWGGYRPDFFVAGGDAGYWSGGL